MKSVTRILRTGFFLLAGLGCLPSVLAAQQSSTRTTLGDGVVAVDLASRDDEESRFDELMTEARLIFADAVVADKSGDTLDAAFYFDLLFEAMADVEQLPLLDELQMLEFNRFLSAAIAFYENDSQTLEKVETSLTVSALRDELSRYTRLLPTDLGDITPVDYDGEGHLPIVYNDQVGRIIQFFRTQGRLSMQIWLNRLPRYLKIMGPILEEEGVPEELVYHAMVESGLNPRAYSWRHAVGPWQFISSTARLYGLRQDWWVDERRDFEKSTRAAARHLKRLYDEFGDWYLALAAYNTGEVRVRRAMRVHQSSDYWKLSILPRETRNHVPKVLAAFLLAQDPEKYGLTVDPEPELEWDIVEIDRYLTFNILAQIAETSVDTLKFLNPELRQEAIPPPEDGDPPYLLRIPKGHKEAFTYNFDPILAQVGPVTAVTVRTHSVRRGETLYSISRRYGIAIPTIVRANGIANRHRLQIGQRLRIPIPSSGVASRQEVAAASPGATRIYYTVRAGDNLSQIAEDHGFGLSQLRSWNGLRPGSSYIRVGQKLAIYPPATPRTSILAAKPPANMEGMEKYIYTVRPGDSLGQIAEAHGIGLSKLRSWNGIRTSSNYIRVGQRLVIWMSEG